MTMNSRERVRVSLSHKQPDRVPRGFFADAVFMGKLRSFLGVSDDDEALESLQIDLRHVEPIFVGPQERSGGLHHIDKAFPDFWGVPRKLVKNEYGVYSEIAGYPLADATTVSEIEAYPWPKPTTSMPSPCSCVESCVAFHLSIAICRMLYFFVSSLMSSRTWSKSVTLPFVR